MDNVQTHNTFINVSLSQKIYLINVLQFPKHYNHDFDANIFMYSYILQMKDIAWKSYLEINHTFFVLLLIV
jgi:hypothetical protein